MEEQKKRQHKEKSDLNFINDDEETSSKLDLDYQNYTHARGKLYAGGLLKMSLFIIITRAGTV